MDREISESGIEGRIVGGKRTKILREGKVEEGTGGGGIADVGGTVTRQYGSLMRLIFTPSSRDGTSLKVQMFTKELRQIRNGDLHYILII